MGDIQAETYREDVRLIKNAILSSRYRTATNADADNINLYYGIGCYISEHTRSSK